VKGLRIGSASLGASVYLLLSTPLMSFAAPPTPDLNSQLLTSICQGNWRQAIRVVDDMKKIAPGHLVELNAYRSQLVAIASSGGSFSSPACGSGSRSVASPGSKPAFSSNAPGSPFGSNQSLQDYSDSIRP
jgi:hypothetical protein